MPRRDLGAGLLRRDAAALPASGVYSNYLADEGDARVRAAYGPAWTGSSRSSARWDPDELFRLNQNVAP